MLASPDDVIFATERARCKSTMMVSLLNKFGEAQGFEKLLARLQEEDTTLEHAFYMVDCLAKCGFMLHKSFVDKFLVRL